MEPSGKQKKDTAAEYLAVNCFSWGVNAQKKKTAACHRNYSNKKISNFSNLI